jgi:hypothetical protein
MIVVFFILNVLGGALICNAIPHLTAGLRGELFPSPFTAPRGIAPSPPEMNVIWGSANLLIGLLLLCHFIWLGFAIGFVAAGYFLARHFGRARAAGFKPDEPTA